MRNVNTFRDSAFAMSQALPRREARTDNGMRALASTLNANVDLFGSIGAMRGKNVIPAFERAYRENKDTALRVAQWARDIRGGSGERKLFRDILLWLEANDPAILVESKLLDNVANIGRFDDLLIFTRGDVKGKAFGIIWKALENRNGLAAKWMPRQGPVAAELRNWFGLTPKQWRKLLVRNTNVVETAMCNREFNSINFSHVPSVAMSRYMTAFHKRAPEAFTAYKAALKRGDKEVKVNASAVFPYDVVRMVGGARGSNNHEGYGSTGYYASLRNTPTYHANGNEIVAQRMWEALPDYMDGTAVLPIVDVSGSMASAHVTDKVTALDVAVSLGLYCSEKSKNPAFKDMVMTFSDKPKLFNLSGSLTQRLAQMSVMSWGMNTNLHKALQLVLDTGLQGRVPDDQMPKVVVILSDMQFDSCAQYDDSALQMIRRKYEAAGYSVPQIVFWNLNDHGGNKPVRFNEKGVALVSGFSPAIMKSVLAADLQQFTPESVMLKTIGVERYNW